MTRKQKKLLQRILAAGVLFTAGMLLPYLLPGGLFLPRLELAGYDLQAEVLDQGGVHALARGGLAVVHVGCWRSIGAGWAS